MMFWREANRELEAAVGAVRNSMLSLTRVPGVGSQSDLESRVAALQFPSTNEDPAVNARTFAQLKLYVDSLGEKFAADNKQPQAPSNSGGLTPEEERELQELRARLGKR